MNQLVLISQPLEELQQAGRAHLAGEQAPGDVVGGVLAAVGSQPAAHGVQVDADGAQNLFVGHGAHPPRRGLLKVRRRGAYSTRNRNS